MMRLDPQIVQWIASMLLVLSGIQNLVVVGRPNTAIKFRIIGGIIALAAIGFGVLMIITLLGVRI